MCKAVLVRDAEKCYKADPYLSFIRDKGPLSGSHAHIVHCISKSQHMQGDYDS